ncbi:MAG: SUMF1/EgtB/PvdO family nonheme iron enzyme [Cyanobacteria bacterium]|nr:SUMF1/EgtB/PvdO family nonheme iron enzyme [Cyanobacteria bacterium GSL.Bin21]
MGCFSPNALGLYDLHGHVWEWCQDDWHDNYQGAPNDSRAWHKNGKNTQVRRGGSWYNNPVDCRSAIRNCSFPNYCSSFYGFRVVCGHPNTIFSRSQPMGIG